MIMDLDVAGFEEPKPFTEIEQQAIADLRELCSQNSTIHFQLDNYFLTKFLRSRNWNAKDAFDAIINFYTLKHNHPTLYASKNVSEYMETLSMHSRIWLGKRDKCGRLVFLAKLANMKSPMQFNDAAIIDDLWMEVISSMPITQMNGLSVVVDCKGLGSFIFKWLIPKNCKVSSSKMDVFPIRDWTIHLVNMGPILKTCVALVKPFLSKTAVAKFQLHTNGLKDLVEQLGPDCLPDEYGGTSGPIDCEQSLKFLLAHEKWLEQNRQFGVKANKNE